MAIDPKLLEAISALEQAKKVDIKGKQYAQVSTRVEIFRKTFGIDWSLVTAVIESGDPDIVRVVATVADPGGRIVATGHAQEDRTMNKINEVSSLEVAETSAIGRALAGLGLMGGEYASAFEMEVAIAPVKAEPKTTQRVRPRQTPQEFRQDIVDTFKPEINQYTFLVPPELDGPGIDIIFTEIDRISDVNELTAYWKAIEHLVSDGMPADTDDIKATFKSRNAQLKG